MAFQSVVNSAEAVITYAGHGQEFKNIVHAQKVSGYDLTDLEALAAAVDASVVADWLPIQSSDYTYLNTTVRGLNAINDQETTDDTGSAAGGGGANALPDNVTLSIKKSSGLTGRSARGRLYWIGTPLGKLATNENQYTTAGRDEIVAAVEALRVAIGATAWDPIIVSRWLDNVKRSTGAVFPWVDTVAVNINVDSQRRRLIN